MWNSKKYMVKKYHRDLYLCIIGKQTKKPTFFPQTKFFSYHKPIPIKAA